VGTSNLVAKQHLDATSEAYHIAVTHDNVEAAYNDRMKGIQQVKEALQHERLVATKEGPVLLTAPAPGDYPYANPYWRGPYGPGYWPYYGAPGVGLEGTELSDFAEHLYDDIETDMKAHNGAVHASFSWMAQDINPSAPLEHMGDGNRLAESLRRARLADRNAKEAFFRYEQSVAGTVASKLSKDTGVEVSVATPQPQVYPAPYFPYFDGPGVSPAQRIMASRGVAPQQ